MTEAEWLASTYSDRMLRHVLPTAIERKLRLFACGSWRLGWELVRAADPDPVRRLRIPPRTFSHSRDLALWELVRPEDPDPVLRVVWGAERYADGLGTEEELAPLRRAALGVASGSGGTAAERTLEAMAARWWWWLLLERPADARELDRAAERPWAINLLQDEIQQKLACLQAAVLRDVFGNPFRTVPAHPPWRAVAAVQLAEAIYAERAFDRLPVLADALEEAGCTRVDVLDHCRVPAEHVRGCWVLDLLLGKN
jgi:hypothetical protein